MFINSIKDVDAFGAEWFETSLTPLQNGVVPS